MSTFPMLHDENLGTPRIFGSYEPGRNRPSSTARKAINACELGIKDEVRFRDWHLTRLTKYFEISEWSKCDDSKPISVEYSLRSMRTKRCDEGAITTERTQQ